MPAEVHTARIRELNPGREVVPGPVVYWMSRDQRIADNWALIYAAQQASRRGTVLAVVFCLAPGFLGATMRQYGFMLSGLAQVEARLRRKNIAFFLRPGEVVPILASFLLEIRAGLLVTDFDPLRVKRAWKDQLLRAVDIPVHEVDAHNIVPCLEASAKREYAARTLRPRILRRLEEFLTEFPDLPNLPAALSAPAVDWDAARQGLRVDRSVPEVGWLAPGENAAREKLAEFIAARLEHYDRRNDPNAPVLSDLSPYLHFGQISAQRAALTVMHSSAAAHSRQSFLEELIVRRELADNFCLHTPDYDTVDGFPDWAQRTLDKHRSDDRDHLYDQAALEVGATHDPLWNAAQTEMVVLGKMHGYMRMYWAKKILEWSASPEQALAAAIRLNDKYELDGRDPNGYTGIAWSIGGVHDRPWFERPVFGQIRYMSAAGCARKFDVGAYVRRISSLTP